MWGCVLREIKNFKYHVCTHGDNKLLREDKVLDFLNDSCVCLVTEAKQTPVMIRQRPHLSRCEWYSQTTEEMKKDRRIHCLQRDVGLRFEVIAQTFFFL